MYASLAVFALSSYLLGSLPFGRFVTERVAGIDITQRGSGNIGATNVARVVGIKWGIFTLVLDVSKGFIPVFLFLSLYPDSQLGLSLVALSTLLGHQFSVFQGFRGGKGVATALGIYLAVAPLQSLIAGLVFIFAVLLSDFVSLGSLISAFVMPILLIVSGKGAVLVLSSFLMAGLICFRHRDNIGRLIRGEERRWRRGSG